MMGQLNMFEELGIDESWKEHWQDMPEYIQEDKEATKSVAVHFETPSDILSFNKATGLNITMETRGVFFPSKSGKKIKYMQDDE